MIVKLCTRLYRFFRTHSLFIQAIELNNFLITASQIIFINMIFKKINFNYSRLALFLCFIGVLLLQNNYRNKIIAQTKNIDYIQEEKNLQTKINLQKIIPGFGFNNLKADWLFLNFVQYLGDKTAREKTGYSLTPQYFANIIEDDINFLSAYLILANANTMYAGQPENSISLIEEVLNSSSAENDTKQYYLLWLHKAYDELFFLGDVATAKSSYNQAQHWLRQQQVNSPTDRIGGYVPNIELLAKDSDIIQAQILAWSTVLPYVKDKENRQKITEKINSLQLELSQPHYTNSI